MLEANRIGCADTQVLLDEELAGHRCAFEATAAMLAGPFLQTLEIVERGLRRGGKLLLFGNGGSAADAQHIAAELIIRYKTDRPAISAIALTTDSSALTSIANDYGFEAVFSRQVEALGVAGDMLVGISTSGNSANVIAALQAAREQGLVTVAFTGAGGGKMAGLADHLFAVDSRVTARIQEAHILAGHMLCDWIELDCVACAAVPVVMAEGAR